MDREQQAKFGAMRRTGERPTKAETRERIQYAVELLAKGYPKSSIKKAFKEKWKLSFRTIDRYIHKARDQMISESNLSVEELTAESVAFWKARMRDTSLPPREQSKARENLDKIFGLYKPQKVALTTTKGEDVNVANDQVTERAKRLEAAINTIRSKENIRKHAVDEATEPSDN